MDLTWLAPIVVVVAGILATFALARLLGAATTELTATQRRLGQLERALIPVRVQTRRTRGSVDSISRR